VPTVPPPPPAPSPGRAPGRVLIVDDNVELVGTLQAVLSRAMGAERLEVVTASRGEEALAVARSQGFDVAIVDVKLPDTSGVDLIEPLRAASPLGEVVLITGFASVDAAIGALRSGAFAFVLKSFRPEELLSTVDQALAKVRLQRDREELESRYRALVQLTDVLAAAVDTDGKVALWNRKASQTSGVAAAVALGKDFVESFIAPADCARARSRRASSPSRRGASGGTSPRSARASRSGSSTRSASTSPSAARSKSGPPTPRRCRRWERSR
jgi:PAS domain S-box-containing protein